MLGLGCRKESRWVCMLFIINNQQCFIKQTRSRVGDDLEVVLSVVYLDYLPIVLYLCDNDSLFAVIIENLFDYVLIGLLYYLSV